MRDLATLIASPGRELAAQFLANGEHSAAEEHPGEILDQQAVHEYRQRLQEMAEEKAEAGTAGDESRYAQLEREEDALLEALRGGLGLAGRQRVFTSDQEKARKAISARVRASIKRIEAVHPSLGQHLRNSIHTGILCSYSNPDNIRWQISAPDAI